jgi:hypothetical protein
VVGGAVKAALVLEEGGGIKHARALGTLEALGMKGLSFKAHAPN